VDKTPDLFLWSAIFEYFVGGMVESSRSSSIHPTAAWLNGRLRAMETEYFYLQGTTPDPPENTDIDKYRIGSCRFRTKFALVYDGTDISSNSGTKLALQFVKRFKDSIESIDREIENLRSLSDPGVVPLLDDFPYFEFHCLVFPYAAGGSLKTHLDSLRKTPRPFLPESVVRHIAAQVLTTLQRLHAGGLVHCDIKPANILVTNQDPLRPQVWLADLGVSRSVDCTQCCSKLLGTPGFHAPEVRQGKGCIFHFLTHSHCQG
jgi:serine/threonine-protein kinase